MKNKFPRKKFVHILARFGPNFYDINLKFSQILGIIVVYNLWKFQINSSQIEISTISSLHSVFRLIFFLFRFNWNTETRCFDKEAKQPKQTFCFG